MPVAVTCGSCGHPFRVGDEFAGKDVSCPACRATTAATGPTVSPSDVFVSYSSKDKATADAAVAALEADGVRCWVAPRDIVPGEEWADAIIRGINQSRVVVLVFSVSSNASKQVLREVERAVNRGMPIVPLRIENLLPSRGMEYYISASHWLDAYHPPLDDHLRKLSATARALLLEAPPPRDEGPTDLRGKLRAAARALTARDNRVRVLAGLAATVFLIGLLVFAAVYALRPAPPPVAPPELVQARADAEQLAEKVKGLDPGQGLGPKRDEVDHHLRSGQTLFAQGDFGRAAEHFRAVADLAPTALAADDARREAVTARGEAEKAQAESAAAGSKNLVPDLWAATSQQVAAAGQAFDAGDFATARDRWRESAAAYRNVRANAGKAKDVQVARGGFEKELATFGPDTLKAGDAAGWQAVQDLVGRSEAAYKAGKFDDAATGYREAEKAARGVAIPRLKYLAQEAGELAARVFLVRFPFQPGGSGPPGFGPPRGGGLRGGIPNPNSNLARERYGVFLARLQSPHLRPLGLPDDFPSRLADAPVEQTLIDLLVKETYQFLNDRWGEEVASCYAVGKDLAAALDPLNASDWWEMKQRLPGVARDLAATRKFMVKGGYPAVALARLDRCADLCAGATEETVGPALQKVVAAGRTLADLLPHARADFFQPDFRRRYSAAQGATLFRLAPAAVESVEAMILEKGGLYFPDPTNPAQPVSVVEFQNGKLTLADVARLKELKSLKVLVLNVEVPPEAGAAVREMPNLEVLEARFHATDAFLEQLKGAPVWELDLKFAEGVTDKGTLHLAGLPKLERLNLEKTGVTGAGLAEHLKGLSAFKELVVEAPPTMRVAGGGGYKISAKAISELRQARPDVKVVQGSR